MKLYEAILEGSKIRPQTFLRFYGHGGSCALGAAGEVLASGFIISDMVMATLRERYKFIDGRVHCPAGGCRTLSSTIYNIITHLNDEHQWTRERIAEEFVRPLEEAAEAFKAEVEEVVQEEVGA